MVEMSMDPAAVARLQVLESPVGSSLRLRRQPMSSPGLARLHGPLRAFGGTTTACRAGHG